MRKLWFLCTVLPLFVCNATETECIERFSSPLQISERYFVWKFSLLRLLVLIRIVWRWGWVWSVDGMTLTGKAGVFREKIKICAVTTSTTHGLAPDRILASAMKGLNVNHLYHCKACYCTWYIKTQSVPFRKRNLLSFSSSVDVCCL